jgi:hypothetical protein
LEIDTAEGVDEVVAMCRPVDWPPMAAMLPPDFPEPPVYPDSTTGTCKLCDVQIYVSPRQRKVMKLGGVTTLCFLCAYVVDATVKSVGDSARVLHLISPHEPKGESGA